MLHDLESALASLSFLEILRPDEIGRAARRFSRVVLSPGERREFPATIEGARLIVVVEGRVDLHVHAVGRKVGAQLGPGDRYGEIALLSGHPRGMSVAAKKGALIGTLDREGIDALLVEFPAIAEPLARELARDLSAKNDMMRQLLELHAAELPRAELDAAVDERRRAIERQGAHVLRLSSGALFRRLVVDRGAEPPFWMLVGFLVSLGGARTVVALILKYGLEKRLFALVPGNDPNPMHVHHFNYGLILIGISGLAALAPFGRRSLRLLALVFGFGAGLVFDEFALFWNLNPEYSQSLSLFACAIAVALLVQLTYFRHFWGAVALRGVHALRSGR